MPYDPLQHHRHSIRLPEYDYAAEGAYFITICTHQRQCILSEIIDHAVELSTIGCVVQEAWEHSAQKRQEIRLGPYVLMPNHIHAIVFIEASPTERPPVGRPTVGRPPLGRPPVAPTNRPRGPKPRSLAALMAGFKSATTSRVNAVRGTPDAPLWQRNYYEHIIRDATDYERICTYIEENPWFWQEDHENPANDKKR